MAERPSGSASGHRAHRRLRAEQGRAANGAGALEARHDLNEIAGTVAVEMGHVTKSSGRPLPKVPAARELLRATRAPMTKQSAPLGVGHQKPGPSISYRWASF